MNKNIIIGGSILLLFALVGTRIFLRTAPERSPDNTSTLVIGTAAGYAPFVSINAQGEYEGFDIDVANALAVQMGKKLVIKDLGSMAPLLTALDQGSIDAIIWGLSITQARLNKLTMIHYQGNPTTSYPLVFWKTIPASVHTLSDMAGKTICVEPASAQEAVLDAYTAINKLPTEKIDDALLNIQYGKADAALVEPAIAKKFQRKYPELKLLAIPLAVEDQAQGVGIVVQKKHLSLSSRIQEAIEQLRAAGIIKQLEEKWGMV